MKLIIVACVHGDEKAGLKIQDKLRNLENEKEMELIIGNPEAVKRNKRCIDSDLNRSFPGKKNGDYEGRLACKLKKVLSGKTVIDFHTTSGVSPPFCILTKINKRTIKLARKTGIKNVVFMSKELASGKSLIDHCNGISIELGNHFSEEVVDIGIKAVKTFLSGKESKPNFYKVFDILRKGKDFIPVKLKNFEIVKKREVLGKVNKKNILAKRDFYPMFFGEKSYKDIVCLMAEKIKIR